MALRERLTTNEETGKRQENNLMKLKHEQEGWAKAQQENIVEFGEIMRQQEEERKNNLEKQVIQVLKKKGKCGPRHG